MKSNSRRVIALAIVCGACWSGTVSSKAADKEVEEATSMMNNPEAEERAATAAREKDAAWKPSCSEVGLIQVGNSKSPGALKNFCLNAEGNLLACFAPNEPAAESPGAIRMY